MQRPEKALMNTPRTKKLAAASRRLRKQYRESEQRVQGTPPTDQSQEAILQDPEAELENEEHNPENFENNPVANMVNFKDLNNTDPTDILSRCGNIKLECDTSELELGFKV